MQHPAVGHAGNQRAGGEAVHRALLPGHGISRGLADRGQVCAFSTQATDPVVTALVGGIVITLIALEFRRYLSQIDELARRMQLEAMAWTYLTGFVVAAWLGVAAAFSQTIAHWAFRPAVLLVIPYLFFLLEPVRAGWLYYLSRRY